ncbi:protein src2 [Quercus suber]|uniref:Protein src2 n=1 Tax=Quercus suber TaxID=58331 RepID=A0AAW0KT66_QUESU
MSHRTLDISSISTKDLKLKKVSCFSNKMGLYANVSIDGSGNSSEQKTPIDKNGGSNPIWNSPMKFTINDVAAAQQTVVVKLKAERIIRDKVIGQVRVPMKELLDNYGDSKGENHISYTWEGQRGTGLRLKFEELVNYPTGPGHGVVDIYQHPPAPAYGGYPPPAPAYGGGYPPALAYGGGYPPALAYGGAYVPAPGYGPYMPYTAPAAPVQQPQQRVIPRVLAAGVEAVKIASTNKVKQ